MAKTIPATRQAVTFGARLGAYQAGALAGPPLALLAWAFDFDPLALLYAFGAGVGWAGWRRDYGLRWRA